MTQHASDPRITSVVDFMQSHLAEPLSVERLAALASVSRSRFHALFTAHTGAAPMRYLRRLRLRRARLLAERTFLSTREIMAIVGYNDPSHFSRDFRREHGLPPSALKSADLATSLRKTTGESEQVPVKGPPGPSEDAGEPAAWTAPLAHLRS